MAPVPTDVTRPFGARLAEPLAAAYGLGVLLLASFYLYVAEPRLPFNEGLHRPLTWTLPTSPVMVGDVIVAIDGKPMTDLLRCRACDPYRPIRAGRSVDLVVERDGQRRTVAVWAQPWRVTPPFVLFSLASAIFWVAGMLALFWLRPRGEGWRVLVLCFLTAPVWLASGAASGYQAGLASVVFHLVHWPFWALVFHLHLVLLHPAGGRAHRRLKVLLWATTAAATTADAFALLPRTVLIAALALSILGSLAMLAGRLLRFAPPRQRMAGRIMTFGVAFGLLPLAVSLILLSPWVGTRFRTAPLLYFACSFLPIWPLSYLYTIHRHDLGTLASRANRAAALYAFLALYALAYGLVLLPLQIMPGEADEAASLRLLFVVSLAFVIAAPVARQRFQRFVDRAIFGIRYDPAEMVMLFARRVPTALDRQELRRIVIDEILPTFLLRQSALYLDEGGVFYQQGLASDELPCLEPGLLPPRSVAGLFIPLQQALPAPLGWVRLALPLVTPGRSVGLWLFGRRDPDDFYAKDDIAALAALANQIAPVLENFRLLDAAKAELEKRRSLQLQLEHSQKMEAVGRLAAGIAHDFNNLLAVMLGHCSLMLARGEASPSVQRGLLEIQKAGRRASDLIRQLLVFSRRGEMENRIVDLDTAVQDVAKMLGPLIGEDVELRLRSILPSSRVLIDPGQLGQAIINLAANARDAMPGGGRIVIETATVQVDPAESATTGIPTGSYGRLRIADTGAGMAAEVLSRIFDPFFTTKEAGRGTGLGLSMVYGFVEQSGGHIRVDSELGRGSRFDLFFPVAEAVDCIVARPAAPDDGLAGSETILLVEDADGVREIVRDMLETRGYKVLAAAGAHQALGLARQHAGRVDLLLTDVVMPHLTGPELAAVLASELPGLRVVYMSGYNEATCLTSPAGDAAVLLHKPFEPAELARRVRETLMTPVDGPKVG